VFYEKDGARYLVITNFRQQTRAKSKFPDPPPTPDISTREFLTQAKEGLLNDIKLDDEVGDNHLLSKCESSAQPSRISKAKADAKADALKPLCPPSSDEPGAAAMKALGWTTLKKLSDDLAHALMMQIWERTWAPSEKVSTDPESPYWTWIRLQWFEDFYAAYWRHEAKKDARVAFMGTVKTLELFDRVMAAVDEQNAQMQSREMEKRPLPATWVRGERWNNEVVGVAAEA
jgi:hypothetical protein